MDLWVVELPRFERVWHLHPEQLGPGRFRQALPAMPQGRYELFASGMYSRFVLTGPYSDLPAATGRVFEIVAQRGMMLRSDFCIESYVNDPRTTPEDKLITEILLPTA